MIYYFAGSLIWHCWISLIVRRLRRRRLYNLIHRYETDASHSILPVYVDPVPPHAIFVAAPLSYLSVLSVSFLQATIPYEGRWSLQLTNS